MAAPSHVNGHANGRSPGRSPRGIGADGIPRLPPIEKPRHREDPFANSKLLTFRMARHKQDLLKKIMYVLIELIVLMAYMSLISTRYTCVL